MLYQHDNGWLRIQSVISIALLFIVQSSDMEGKGKGECSTCTHLPINVMGGPIIGIMGNILEPNFWASAQGSLELQNSVDTFSFPLGLLTRLTVAVLWRHLVNWLEGEGGEPAVEEKNGLCFSPELCLCKIFSSWKSFKKQFSSWQRLWCNHNMID